MGLDMYLHAKRYYSNMEYRDEESVNEFKKILEMSGVAHHAYAGHPTLNLEIKVGYWRKANAIHNWFVENCQNGEDDCRQTYVGREKLIELKTLCEEVIKQPAVAGDELPTSGGFFFGSTDYDDFYLNDLKNTIEQINSALEMPEDWDFYYQSSW